MSNQKLGRYELIRAIGHGAMGVVYEARDPNLDRRVAIKTIRVESQDSRAVADYEVRFRTEARSVARLQHPNIVSVYDSDRDGAIAYLVMEFIQGHDLKHYLDSGIRYSLDQVVSIMGDLLSALDYAHRQGVVHRDVKPANILMERGGSIKLTDFGVARIQDSEDATRSRDTVVGTLKYMAPEQLQGARIDSRADLFSAGVVLYQMLTGLRPFEGENDYGVMQQIFGHTPPGPSTLQQGLPPALDAVVARALAKSPNDRFATAAEFNVALRAACESLLNPGDSLVSNDSSVTHIAPPRSQAQPVKIPDATLAPTVPAAQMAQVARSASTAAPAATPVQRPAPSAPVTPASSEATVPRPTSKTSDPVPAPPPAPSRSGRKWLLVTILLAAVGGGAWYGLPNANPPAPPAANNDFVLQNNRQAEPTRGVQPVAKPPAPVPAPTAPAVPSTPLAMRLPTAAPVLPAGSRAVVTVRNSELVMMKELRSRTELNEFRRLWNDRQATGQTSANVQDWSFTVDVVAGNHVDRWLYQSNGLTVKVDNRVQPVYRLRNPGNFNALIGAPRY